MNTRGQHWLVEYTGCDYGVLGDLHRIENLMNEAARSAEATIVASVFQPFVPQGVTGVVVIEESHLSIHTWPEHGYAAVDFFTCGNCRPERAHEVLAAGLRARYSEIMVVERGLGLPGLGLPGRMIRLRSHHTELRIQAGPGETTPEQARFVS